MYVGTLLGRVIALDPATGRERQRAQISMVTRSGTNQFHWSVFEFFAMTHLTRPTTSSSASRQA